MNTDDTDYRLAAITPHERYAEQRIAALTRAVAGCLTPATLAVVVDEIANNCTRPILADLQTFARRLVRSLAVELAVLVDEEQA